MLRYVHEGQRTTHEGQFSPSTMLSPKDQKTQTVRGVHSKSFHPLSTLSDPCNVRNFIPTIGVKFQASVCM